MDQNGPKILFIKSGRTMPVELLRTFKAECCRRDKSMTQVLADLIRRWLQEKST